MMLVNRNQHPRSRVGALARLVALRTAPHSAGPSRRSGAAIVLMASFPAVCLIVATRHGIALDWDAVVYLSAADSFANTGRLISFDGDELTVFAPGLPTTVGSLMALGLDPNWIGVGLGLVSVLCVCIGTYIIARRVQPSAAVAMIVVCVTAVSPSTVRVFSYLKTEAPFAALVTAVAALCVWAIECRRTPWWWVIAVSVLASAATTVRYIGFVLIPLVALAAFLARAPTLSGRPAAFARALAFGGLSGALAGVGLLVVVTRNLSLGSPPLGLREPSGLTLTDVIRDLLGVLGTYVLQTTAPALVEQIGGAVVLTLIMLGVVVMILERSAAGGWLAALVGVYLAALLYSEVNTVIQPINERLMAPIFPFIAVLLATGLSRICRSRVSYLEKTGPDAVTTPILPRRVLKTICLAGTALVIVASSISSLSFAAISAREGIGYNSVAARSSPTRAAMQKLPADAGIAALNGPQVYLAMHRHLSAYIPWTNFFSRGSLDPKIAALKAKIDSGSVDYLVYFAGDKKNNVVPAEDLCAAGIRLTKVGRYADGEIWRAHRS